MAVVFVFFRNAMAIQSLVRFRRVAAVADPRAITSLVADHLLIQKRVPDHCLVHLAEMAASIRAVQDIHTLDHALGHVHILVIADVVTVVTLGALVQDVADM